MRRGAAISYGSAGARKIWAGSVTIPPDARTGAHHRGELESVIYVVRGRARLRWGDRLEYFADAGPGDFIYVPPLVPHQELNAGSEVELVCARCALTGGRRVLPRWTPFRQHGHISGGRPEGAGQRGRRIIPARGFDGAAAAAWGSERSFQARVERRLRLNPGERRSEGPLCGGGGAVGIPL